MQKRQFYLVVKFTVIAKHRNPNGSTARIIQPDGLMPTEWIRQRKYVILTSFYRNCPCMRTSQLFCTDALALTCNINCKRFHLFRSMPSDLGFLQVIDWAGENVVLSPPFREDRYLGHSGLTNIRAPWWRQHTLATRPEIPPTDYFERSFNFLPFPAPGLHMCITFLEVYIVLHLKLAVSFSIDV